MLGQAAGYLIAILGCGEADAPCQQVAVAPVSYTSQAECQAATDAALSRYGDQDFPVVVAECRRAGATPTSLRADEIRRPDARGVIGRVATAGR